jgi:hypothetical protein
MLSDEHFGILAKRFRIKTFSEKLKEMCAEGSYAELAMGLFIDADGVRKRRISFTCSKALEREPCFTESQDVPYQEETPAVSSYCGEQIL